MIYRLVKNLEFVCPANDSSSCHGIFKNSNSYYLTNIDGGGNNFSLVVNNEKHWIHPNGFRDMIFKYYKVKIPLSKKIYIHPCNSYLIYKYYKKELVKNNISLIKADAIDGAYFIFSDGIKVYFRPNERRATKGEKFDILFLQYISLNREEYDKIFIR